MRLKDQLYQDSVSYFDSLKTYIYGDTGNFPDLYFVHIKPKRKIIYSLSPHERLDFVEDLIENIVRRVQSRLLRHPTRDCNNHLLIRSKNFIESHTKYGNDESHHSHGIWAIHPDISEKFKLLLIDFNKELIKDENRDKYDSREIYTLNPTILVSWQDCIHSLLIERVSHLEKSFNYCLKNFNSYYEPDRFSGYDTNTKPIKNKYDSNCRTVCKKTKISWRRLTPLYSYQNKF